MSQKHPLVNLPLPKDWKVLTVDEIKAPEKHSCVAGPFGSSISSKYFVESGIPVIRGSNLSDGLTRFIDSGFVFVSEERAKKYQGQRVVGDDLVFTCWGTVGQVGIVPCHGCYNEYIISNKQLKLRVDKTVIDPLYTYFYFASPAAVAYVRSHAKGAAVPGINLGILKGLKVAVPPLPIQRRIASILSAYDDLIENNTRRIAILEEMARRLYEEWFVKFRFPGYEDVGFDGEVPEGWREGTLQDVVVLQRGFDLPKKKREQGRYPVLAATGRHGTHSEAKVKGPGVVTGRSGSLGTVTYMDTDFWPLNTTLWGKSYPLGSALYAYFMLSMVDLKGFNSGAAVPTLNRNDVHDLPMLLPPSELVNQFDSIAQPLFDLKFALQRKNINLRTQRGLLLPKLISGQIDVSEIALRSSEVAAA